MGANLVHRALAFAFGDYGFGGVLAGLELRLLRLFLIRWPLLTDGNVLAAREDGAAFGLGAVGRADLDKLRFRGNDSHDVSLHFRLIAAGVGAVVLFAKVGKQ